MNKGIVYSACLALGCLLVLAGAIAKIQHWPLANKLLTCGMLLNILVALIAVLPLLLSAVRTGRQQQS